jgi:hypothetical protein
VKQTKKAPAEELRQGLFRNLEKACVGLRGEENLKRYKTALQDLLLQIFKFKSASPVLYSSFDLSSRCKYESK